MPPRRRSMLDHVRVVLSWRELGGPGVTLDEVIAVVRTYNRNSMLAVLVRLNLALTHHAPVSQAEVLRLWVPDNYEAFSAAMKQHRSSHIFTESQVLNLIRLAILFASPCGGRRCESQQDFRDLVALLLMMSDFYMAYDGPSGDGRARLFASLTRSELFLHDEHRDPAITARNYDLFAALPRQRRGGFDLPGTFARVAGLEVEDYLGLGFGLLTHYMTIGASLMATAAIGMQRTYFDNANLRQDVRDAMWRLVSMPLDSYQTALRAEWDATTGAARWSAMRTFSEYPMIEMPDGTLVAVSRRLLRDRVTHGIYWVLANALKGNDRQQFTNYFGEIFEEYVQRCFRRALGRGFLSRATYGRASRPLVDGALATKRSLGLCECKARRLLLDVRQVGSEEDLARAVSESLEKAAAQLADAVEAGQRGEIHGVATGADTVYHPLIVTYEPLPSHPLAMGTYAGIIHRDGRLVGAGIRPVTLINTRDVEALEALISGGAVSWPDFLNRKHTSLYERLSFHHYVYEQARGGKIPPNAYLTARFEQVSDMIGMRLFGQRLSESET